MDKIAAQLTDLILGAVPTMVILVVLYIFLKAIFFNPLEKLLKERHAATEGSQHEARKSVAAAEAKAAEYAAALERARADVHRNREAARQEALKARAELVDKNRAAAKARTEGDFLLVARTDARAVEGFDAAVERAHAYLAAGADAIFPEALETAREFREFAKRVRAPLMANMTEFGRSPSLSVRQFAAAGYRMVLFPLTAFRASMKTTEECLRDLQRRGSQRSWLGRMQTRAELYELLGYDPKTGDFSRGG